ncbi:hypothetical protein quinque_014917 [Culex quinquefasciatus]
MPEFDDTFLFDCAKFERKKWKSYNISLRPSSIVLKSVGSFSPNVNNNNNYLEEGEVIGGGLRPISDPPVVKKRDYLQNQRTGVVNSLYGGVSPIRERILGYNFKRHSYSCSSAPTSPAVLPSFFGGVEGGGYCDSATSGSSVTISTSTHTTPRNSASSITSNTGGNFTAAAAATTNNSPAGGGGPTENGDKSQVTPGAPGSSGHKGSIRGNKLARRARSFKDDFLEKISQIRTPTSTMTRSHSPNSPRSGSAGGGGAGGGGVGGNRKSDDLLASSKPVQDLNYHVRQVKNALTHFKDVILKNKLEMLPGNGTVVLELVANVHTALQSYTLNENSSALINATNHVYMSLGNLLKLCDEVLLTADNENCPSLSKENVKEIVELVENAVNNLVNLANEKISDKAAGSGCSGNHHSSNTLQRPAVDIAGQRTSLPDIPLTPRERDILEQTSLKTVRASHSTESILRDSSPPPKPPLPDRAQDPPPLPPKRKSQHSKNHSFHETSDADSTFLGGGCGGALDRMSLRSRSPEDNSSLLSASAGSLDSALNHSREEDELRALTNTSSSAITTATIHDKASLLGLGQACRNNSNEFMKDQGSLLQGFQGTSRASRNFEEFKEFENFEDFKEFKGRSKAPGVRKIK